MNTPTTKTSERFQPAAAILWASAFIIAAIVIVQAGRLETNPAHADMTAVRGSYTLMTTNSGRGGDTDPDELLYVIDSRDGTLLVYEVEDARRKSITFRDGGSLANLFIRARQ